MDEIQNPYRPGAGSPPPALLGRDELIKRFGVLIRRAMVGRTDKSLMPIGLRGVGKTVLLNRFAEIAKDEGWRVAFVEAPETQEFRILLASHLRKTLLELDRSGRTEAIRKALGILKAFTVHLPDGTSFQVDADPLFGQGDSGILADDVTDLLVGLGEAARSRSLGCLLAIDEVQYLSSDELGALITAIHRTTQLNLPVVLVGAGLPQLPGLAGDAKSYAERLFDFPEIGSLAPEDASAAISIPAHKEGVEFEGRALRRIVAEAHGYPYFLQEWGFHVWNMTEASPVREEDVENAKEAVTQQLDKNFFLVRFDRLTPKEKVYLRAMAELGAGPHRSGDIASCLGVKVESVAPRRSALIAKGMIYSPAHGDTAFTVPLFDRYLKRAVPQWEPKGKASS
ncbi:MAG TPA: ATP-binding protein [Thermoanaerobaculia bacterium]|nr:ATP-binding protein [Thermoanaerobaculia bacterium]